MGDAKEYTQGFNQTREVNSTKPGHEAAIDAIHDLGEAKACDLNKRWG